MNSTLRSQARIAGVFYLLTFVGGGLALVVGGKVGMVAGLPPNVLRWSTSLHLNGSRTAAYGVALT
jgi:hypothetical protein